MHRRILTCCVLALLMGSCRSLPLAPSSPDIAQPGATTEASGVVVEVSARDWGDSLEFTIRCIGRPFPLQYGIGLNTDNNENTGVPVSGGPDYIAGWFVNNALMHVTSPGPDGPWTSVLAGYVGWRQTGNHAVISVAWADLPPPIPGLPWQVDVYEGDINNPDSINWIGRWDGIFENEDAVAL